MESVASSVLSVGHYNTDTFHTTCSDGERSPPFSTSTDYDDVFYPSTDSDHSTTTSPSTADSLHNVADCLTAYYPSSPDLYNLPATDHYTTHCVYQPTPDCTTPQSVNTNIHHTPPAAYYTQTITPDYRPSCQYQQTNPTYVETTTSALTISDLSIDDRFNKLINTPTNISPYASQLHNFYREESVKLHQQKSSTLQNMQISQTFHLRPLIDNYFDQQICTLNSRISGSLCFLEQYTVTHPTTTQQPATDNSISSTPARGDSKQRLTRRPPKHLNNKAAALLENWYSHNLSNPYPDHNTIAQLSAQGDISKDQVKKWFCNKRSRSSNTRSFNDIVKLRRACKVAAKQGKSQYKQSINTL